MDAKQETWPLPALKEQVSEINYGQIPWFTQYLHN